MAVENICIFGDSVTWGAWDHELGGWVNRLRMAIEARDGDDAPLVYNCGISGDTSADLLERFDVEARARQPQLTIIDVGGNDAAQRSDGSNLVELTAYEANLRTILEQAKRHGNVLVLSCDQPVDEGKSAPVSWAPISYHSSELRRYAVVAAAVAKDADAAFTNPYEKLQPSQLPDGIHPNAEAHALVARTVLATLDRLGWLA